MYRLMGRITSDAITTFRNTSFTIASGSSSPEAARDRNTAVAYAAKTPASTSITTRTRLVTPETK